MAGTSDWYLTARCLKRSYSLNVSRSQPTSEWLERSWPSEYKFQIEIVSRTRKNQRYLVWHRASGIAGRNLDSPLSVRST